MRPIVNVSEEDRAADIGNMHKKFRKDRSLSVGKKSTFRRYAIRPIVNVSEKDRATDTGSLVKIACVVPEISSQTDRHTSILITVLRKHSRGQGKNVLEMWANAQRDCRPAEHRWRALFNAA